MLAPVLSVTSGYEHAPMTDRISAHLPMIVMRARIQEVMQLQGRTWSMPRPKARAAWRAAANEYTREHMRSAMDKLDLCGKAVGGMLPARHSARVGGRARGRAA